MAREVRRLRSKKPVVAYMGSVAASGGYYVSALAQHITARPLTVTGSIGVIAMKLHTQGVYDRFSLRRRALARGANALIYSDMEALDPQSRRVFARSIGRVYGDFKATVAEGRCLPNDNALEDICGGRVWTGEQARDRKLVDQLGGFNDAMCKAIELAKLDTGGKRVGWQLVTPGKQYALPAAFAAARDALNPAAWLAQAEALRALLRSTSTWMLSQWGVEKTQ
jgi:protease IV